MKKIKPLGTTDLQFRIGMSMMTIIVIGLISFAIWAFAKPPGGFTWSGWYYPFGITAFLGVCVFIAPERTMGVMADLVKGFAGTEDP